MIGIAGASGMVICMICLLWILSFAYWTACSNDAVAWPRPCIPTSSRASFINWNITFIPERSSPRSSPTQFPFSPKFRVAVAEPLMPILCSRLPVSTSFDSPRLPSSLTLIFGTMKIEMPPVPGGSPSIRARTG